MYEPNVYVNNSKFTSIVSVSSITSKPFSYTAENLPRVDDL